MRNSLTYGLAAAVVIAVAAACGGGGGSTPTTPTSPTTPTTPTSPGGNPTTATITIGTDGRVSPSTVTIAVGGRVTFINNHNVPHDMSSDPHPEHTDCTQMAQVGFLTAGQQRTSGNFNAARTCGFHDHNRDTDTGLQGRIVIQ
jgi:plastocyanin